MKYSVQIIDKATKEVVDSLECNSERDAERMLQGVSINLNHSEFKAKIVQEIEE